MTMPNSATPRLCTPADPTAVKPTEAEVAEVFGQHRWKSMGVVSVTCECGEILHGDDNMTQFSADEAFRLHMASHILALFAAQPTVAQVKAEALREAADGEEARCTGDWNGTVCDTCRASANRLRARADRIESEG